MDTVSVGRLSVDCVVPRNHPNPTLVKQRLDDVALGPLGEALAELLAPLSRLGDEVIIIRRLELSFDLDTGDALPDVARRWAARLAASIAESLRPEARATMLRFADEAHYLARFLVDTAGGHAAQRWYYRRYRGLAALAQPAALRSAILDEPARGLTALQTLSASELTTVLAALGAREAQRVLETLMAHDAAAEPADDLVPALVATAAAWRPVATALPSSWSAALAWLALASPSLHATELAPAARLVAAVTAWQHARIVARARATTDVVAARADDWAPDLAPLLALPESQRRALAVALGAADERRPAAAPPSLYTPFGGLFLLLPRVAELPLADLWPDDAGGAHDLACTRLAVLARAAGAERAARVANDAVLRRILGVDAQLDLDDWLAANAAHLAAALPTLLAARSLPWARAVTLAIARWPAGDLMQIAIAEPEQEWLALAPLTAQLRTLLRAADASQPFEELPIVPEPTLPRAHALGRVLRHVVVATSAAPAAEPALALAAQHVLARFARRLPGFAASSPGFLFDNFLDADAVVVESGGSFHCRVGKPRLVALLGLTGALRGRTRITCGATILELYPEG